MPFEQGRTRHRAIDDRKAQSVSRSALRQARQIGTDHRGDLRISANRLAIGKQHDRLAVAAHLYAAGDDALPGTTPSDTISVAAGPR